MVWVRPKYVVTKSHTLPDGSHVTVKAGTQIIDRFWQHIRAITKNHSSAGVGSIELRNLVRRAQWEHWNRGEDLWAKAGEALDAMQSAC